MRNYLSFGGGVNSVALHLLMLDKGVEFESVFVHHGTDWPETYHYLAGFQWWLKSQGHRPITILRPDVNTVEGVRFDNVYGYYKFKKTFPAKMTRSCTDRFKIQVIYKYCKTPCFMFIGIDNGEAHRAKISFRDGVENRYPLVEQMIDRDGCKQIISRSGLPLPTKSGCYICPFQKLSEWKRLRHEHPELFCAAEKLENQYIERRSAEGKKPMYITQDRPLKYAIEEHQMSMLEEDQYPPCQCGL